MRIPRATIEKIRRKAKAHFRTVRGSHGWEHTERVTHLALHIGRSEGADAVVLELAALLHDIGRHREDESRGAVCHAREGAGMAREILVHHRIAADLVDRIVHCIEHHRFRGAGRPETLEARVIFDADKLDAIGAVGLGRAFLFAGEQGARLTNSPGVDAQQVPAYGSEDTAYREYLVKLRHISKRMLTAEGRRLAKDRDRFMKIFFRQLREETRGRR